MRMIIRPGINVVLFYSGILSPKFLNPTMSVYLKNLETISFYLTKS